jgi:hypothetical protein
MPLFARPLQNQDDGCVRGLTLITLLAAAVTAGAAAAPAQANHGPLPWLGGLPEVSAFEHHIGPFASQLARRDVSVICNGANDWAILAAQGRFDASRVWGYVTFQWFHEPGRSVFGPIHYAQVSDKACWYLDEFWAAPDKRATTVECQVGTKTEYRTEFTYRTKPIWVTKRVTVGGKKVTKRIRAVRRVAVGITRAVEVPVTGRCADYLLKLRALQTLSHESMHLQGIRQEGLAECYGMQLIDDAARWLGTELALSREIARDYWTEVYLKRSPRSSYRLYNCVDGDALDLNPGSAVWPAG